jgi:hypothetical protein
MIDQDYSENISEYKNSRKNEYTYDANNNNIFWARDLWASFTDMNYEWIKTSDNSYVYDSNNQETERLTPTEYSLRDITKLTLVWIEDRDYLWDLPLDDLCLYARLDMFGDSDEKEWVNGLINKAVYKIK